MEPKFAARAKPSWILLDATRVRAEHGFCQALLPEMERRSLWKVLFDP